MKNRLYKTEAIVIKSMDLGEADKIVTLFSPALGKIRAVAKGIRKTKSKFGARLEPFTCVNLLLYKGRNLDIVSQAEIIHPFRAVKDNLDRINYGCLMLDIIDKVSQEGEKEKELFRLLFSALETLSEMTKSFELLLAAFQLKVMALIGYLPQVSLCAGCGSQLASENMMKFSFSSGGILCARCSGADSEALPISPQAASLISKLMKADRFKLQEMVVASETQRELFSLAQMYLNYYLEVPFRTFNYLMHISEGESPPEKDNDITGSMSETC